jgi:outer membrane protein
MRKIWTIVAAGLMSVSPLALQAETLTDALISAYRNSNLLTQNQAVLRAADEDLATAVGTLRPVFSYSVDIGASALYNPFTREIVSDSRRVRPGQNDLSTSTTLSLIASMNLYDFGRSQLTINLRNELVLASRQSLISIEQDVLLDAVSAYVNLGLQAELVAAQESNVRLITRDLRAAKDRFEVGEVTRTDVALAEAQLASANSALAASQGNYNVARERYKAAIGHYPGKLSGLPKTPITARNLDAARDIALRTHPAVLQSQRQAKAAEISVELARAEMLPTVEGSASLSQTFAGDGSGPLFSGGSTGPINERLGITMKQTIYAGGRLSSALRKAIANHQSSVAGLLQTGVNVEEAVGRAWSNILVANVSIQAGDQQIRAAQAAYDGIKQEADLGSRTLLDVLDADQNLLSAKATRLQAQANLYISQYQLLSAMGLLTADHLGLGIPTFDPTAYLNAVKNAPATSGRGKKLDSILKTLGK